MATQNSINNLLATTALTGALQAAQFPALTGDITTSAGALATTLKNTGPGAGSFTNSNITIDAQGRVTAAANGTSTYTPPPMTVVSGTTQAAAVNNTYVSNNAGLCTITLPSTAAVGTIIGIRGLGAGGWALAQNASQLIHFGNSVTTTGTGGSLASQNAFDSVTVENVVANTTWVVSASQGNITVA